MSNFTLPSVISSISPHTTNSSYSYAFTPPDIPLPFPTDTVQSTEQDRNSSAVLFQLSQAYNNNNNNTSPNISATPTTRHSPRSTPTKRPRTAKQSVDYTAAAITAAVNLASNDITSSTNITPKSRSKAIKQSSSYNRKEKSLSLLCNKFLSQFDTYNTNTVDEQQNQINLDSRAAELGVERRRVYDIVNILESINMVNKRGKNLYIWYGTQQLHQSLQLLYNDVVNDAVMVVDGVKLSAVKDILLPHRIDEIMNNTSFSAITRNAFDMFPSAITTNRTQRSYNLTGHTNNKEHSLGALSQLFVQLFFATPYRILSLEDAAILLMRSIQQQINIDREAAQSSFKSKVRRLYDIANVLSSAKLIEKVHVVNTRKSAFRWRGAGVFPLESAVDSSYAVIDDMKNNIITPVNAATASSTKRRKTSISLSPSNITSSMHSNYMSRVNTMNQHNNDNTSDMQSTVSPESNMVDVKANIIDLQYDINMPIKTRSSLQSQLNNKQYIINNDNNNPTITIKSNNLLHNSVELLPLRTAYCPNDIPNINAKALQRTIDTLTKMNSYKQYNNMNININSTTAAQMNSKQLKPCQTKDEFDSLRSQYNVLPVHDMMSQFNNACKVWLEMAEQSINSNTTQSVNNTQMTEV